MSISFGKISVAIDGSKHAEEALETAISLADKYRSELTIIAVAPLVQVFTAASEPWITPQMPASDVDRYRTLIDQAVAQARAEGVHFVTGICLEGVVVDELVAHVERHPTDLLVLGSRGLSAAKRLLLGSVSDAVSHHAPCPVLLVRRKITPAPATP